MDDKPTNGMNSTSALNTMPLADSEMGLVYYGLLNPHSCVNSVNMLGLGHTQSGTYSSEEYSLFSLMMPMVPAPQTLLSDFPLSETFAEMPQAANDRNLDDCPPLPSIQSNPPFYQASLPTPSLRGLCEQPQNHSSPIDLEMKQDRASGASQRHQACGVAQTQQQPPPQGELSGTMPLKNIVFESNEPGQPDLSTFPFRTGASRKEANGPFNSQAAPYSCEKVNPGTGKPCKTTFSRPYDLTRHENSIHTHKKRIRCDLCIEEKTFSRADALTRHYRVCHPDTELTIKRRRRKTCASQTVGAGDKHVDRSQNDVVGEWFGQ
ncbi:26S proteasome subunit RPN4 [Apiospora kogelbergensis]|uniref:26S proteasome subunit RPN4 n=1 Tax=Apiospora kogelbergensis TaxID=1337665 RepID=A0AAW0QL75_9PEZI